MHCGCATRRFDAAAELTRAQPRALPARVAGAGGGRSEDFRYFGDAPVITVGEVTDFARRGGSIRFYLDGNKVRFEINPVSAQRGGVKLSTQLLSVARVLPPESPKQGE
ncbi:MAG: YfiR family protein [Opitutaceae bacterium]|nr:YfiR family protein [Opitutaceae bacterium]